MRWLEDVIFDGWWSTQAAIQFSGGGQDAPSITYGDLMRRSASLATRLRDAVQIGGSPRVAVFTAGGPEHIVADLAGLMAGLVVVSVPIAERHIWPDDLLDDTGVVIADAPGRRALSRFERSTDRQGLYEVVPVSFDAPMVALTPPALRGEQDDVCKVTFVDDRVPHRMVALTGFALDSIVGALRRTTTPRRYSAAGDHQDRLVEQVWVYRTLAVQGTVVFPAAPQPPNLGLSAQTSGLREFINNGPVQLVADIFSHIVEGHTAIAALATDLAMRTSAVM